MDVVDVNIDAETGALTARNRQTFRYPLPGWDIDNKRIAAMPDGEWLIAASPNTELLPRELVVIRGFAELIKEHIGKE